ncbi:hypothetical protein CRE_00073 [Caenorhabditis remanei]|uniref:Uncharacterized protein n=1 Tax=Caenorhabditis remanei TaxID=31234 RepID=E3LCY5_CAERE|nr:hypothetical protein CRE_00073 [Caenorhabditis remanei]
MNILNFFTWIFQLIRDLLRPRMKPTVTPILPITRRDCGSRQPEPYEIIEDHQNLFVKAMTQVPSLQNTVRHLEGANTIMALAFTKPWASEVLYWVPRDKYYNMELLEEELRRIKLCVKAESIQLLSVAIDPVLWDAILSETNFKDLAVLKIENVHEPIPTNIGGDLEEPFILDNIINQYIVPPVLLKTLLSNNAHSIELVSLHLTETNIQEMETVVAEQTSKNVSKLKMEDLMLPPGLNQRMDEVVFGMIETGGQSDICLSIQLRTYGHSLLRRILTTQTRFNHIHLEINVQQANLSLFEEITQLHPLCNKIKITFHGHFVRLGNQYQFTEEMTIEMRKWEKVTHVILGKSVYPHFNTEAPENTWAYVNLIRCLNHLPNLRSFGMKDIVEESCLWAVGQFISNSNFEEIIFGITYIGANAMNVLNNLLSSVPITTRSLSLLYFPLNDQSLEILAIEAVLPNTEIDTTKWLSTYNGLVRQKVVSEYLVRLIAPRENFWD